jgi:hypothetical protein
MLAYTVCKLDNFRSPLTSTLRVAGFTLRFQLHHSIETIHHFSLLDILVILLKHRYERVAIHFTASTAVCQVRFVGIMLVTCATPLPNLQLPAG